MRVTTLTPDAQSTFDDVLSLGVITELGAVQIFPGHASLQGAILLSPLRLQFAAFEESFVVQRGFVLVDQGLDEVKIQVYLCERRDELQYTVIKEYLEAVRRMLDQPERLGAYHLRYLEDEVSATTKRLEFLEEQGNKSLRR